MTKLTKEDLKLLECKICGKLISHHTKFELYYNVCLSGNI